MSVGAVAAEPAPEVEDGGPATKVSRWPVIATILLAPILAVLVLRLPLINQLDYADAWFYSAYAWVPKHHFEVFELNYFAVRFPAILSIGAFEHLFGAQYGYVALRYLVSVACGAALYLGVRRFADRRVALATVLLLFLNPFFSRMLLWDYAGFVALSAGLIGVCLWFWSEDRPLRWTLLAGAALATAVFANALLAMLLFVLFAVEAVAALRHGRAAVLRLVARLALSAGAAVAVFAIGYLGYAVTLGNMTPDELLEPTIRFLSNASENSAPFVRPTSEWLFRDPRIWAPVVFCVALVAVMGRDFLGTGVAARCAQVCVAYVGIFWLYRFTVTSSLVETWWAYNYVSVTIAPATGVLLVAAARRKVLVASVVAAALAAILIRNVGGPANDVYSWFSGDSGRGVALLALGVVLAALLAVKVTRVAVFVPAAVLVLVLAVMYAPSTQDGRGGTGVFVQNADQDWDGYLAGKQFIDLVRDNEPGGERVFLWYRGNMGLVNVAWTDLPQYAHTVNQVGADERLDKLTPLGVQRLAQAQASSVLVFSPDRRDLARARAALAADGFGGPTKKAGVLADGKLFFELIRLTQKP